MWQSKPVLVFLLLAVSTVATSGEPLLTRITKGGTLTALYTAPLSAGRPLVLDLSAPAITTPCSGQTTTVTLSANSTDGSNPLTPVFFAVSATCAAAPTGAVGVAGLARSSASFPAQIASFAPNSFALCLPSDGRTGFTGNGVGAAIFGGGPFFLAPPADRPDITTLLSDGVPLRQPFDVNPGYFVTASNGIAVDGTRVDVSGSGALVVDLSSTIPYTQLRSDVYRPFITAFDRAMGSSAKVAAVAPFELCYDSSKLSRTLSGYLVPNVDLMLEGGTNWTVVGGNSMAQVNSRTACFAFVQARSTGAVPVVVLGGFQMENKLVVLDNVKQTLSFTPYLPAREFSCSNFNFTRAA